MSDAPQSKLARVCQLLNDQEARYLVVGAMAMQLWGTTRATRDIDILIEPTVANAERVIQALSELPFNVARDIDPRDLVSRAVTMIGDTPNVDVLTRAWNVQWGDAEQDVRVFVVEGIPIPTVSIARLIESKRTGRTQDDADIEVLEALRARGAK